LQPKSSRHWWLVVKIRFATQKTQLKIKVVFWQSAFRQSAWFLMNYHLHPFVMGEEVVFPQTLITAAPRASSPKEGNYYNIVIIIIISIIFYHSSMETLQSGAPRGNLPMFPAASPLLRAKKTCLKAVDNSF
jgi:hypothetical protein